MNWVHVTINFILSIFMAAVASVASANDNPRLIEKTHAVQIGFYDLLSQKKEIYNAKVTVVNENLISTMTKPDDDLFIFKAKFVRSDVNKQKLHYHYRPIFYNSATAGQIIDGIMDYLSRNTIFLTPLKVGEQPLLFGQPGIFLGDT